MKSFLQTKEVQSKSTTQPPINSLHYGKTIRCSDVCTKMKLISHLNKQNVLQVDFLHYKYIIFDMNFFLWISYEKARQMGKLCISIVYQFIQLIIQSVLHIKDQ